MFWPDGNLFALNFLLFPLFCFLLQFSALCGQYLRDVYKKISRGSAVLLAYISAKNNEISDFDLGTLKIFVD
jgi:hypothetical protein